jgi:predicted RNase H-like HicB family nuclease
MGQLQAIIHKCRAPETGYWAEVPSLPGCVTQGETLEEVQTMIQEAVSVWFASAWDIAMADRKRPISKRDKLVPVFA